MTIDSVSVFRKDNQLVLRLTGSGIDLSKVKTTKSDNTITISIKSNTSPSKTTDILIPNAQADKAWVLVGKEQTELFRITYNPSNFVSREDWSSAQPYELPLESRWGQIARIVAPKPPSETAASSGTESKTAKIDPFWIWIAGWSGIVGLVTYLVTRKKRG